jgi:DNA-binding response OmpR family regulator
VKMSMPDGEVTGSIASILDEVAHRFRDIQRSSERGIALLQMARALADREGKEIDALREIQQLFVKQSQRGASGDNLVNLETQEANSSIQIELDPATGVAEIGQQRVTLTNSEFKVLELLWGQRPSLVSHHALLDHLYPEEAQAETGALYVFIHKLRKKLSALDAQDAHIVSVRGHGWKLVV